MTAHRQEIKKRLAERIAFLKYIVLGAHQPGMNLRVQYDCETLGYIVGSQPELTQTGKAFLRNEGCAWKTCPKRQLCATCRSCRVHHRETGCPG